MRSVLLLLLLVALVSVEAEVLFKLFSQGTPVYRGRADPIVNPGTYAGHSHKVFGCSGFDLGVAGRSDVDYFNDIRQSKCTTMSVSADLSAYWIPDLYYHWPNGSISLVPTGGLTIYYFGRSADDRNPDKFHAFPPGFRMLAGNLHRRSYNDTIPERAISYVCLYGGGEHPGFPTKDRKCMNGLRAQVWFPMCWDGVRTDSPNHMDHVAYPTTRPDGGACPSTHPKKLPGIFMEILFSISDFPHGDGVQPFILSNGDPTGYGLHGDFLNGWDVDVLQAAMDHPSCAATNTNLGNSPQNCLPLAPYIKNPNPDRSCLLEKHIPITEDIGLGHYISHLPGNNPVTYGPANAVPLPGAGPQTIDPNIFRVFIKSKTSGLFLTNFATDDYLTANITETKLSYPQVFLFVPIGDGIYGFQSEGTLRWISNNGNSGNSPLIGNRNSPGGWEQWKITWANGATRPTKAGATGSLFSVGSSKFVSVDAQGVLYANLQSANEEFIFIDANDVPETRPSNIPTSVPPPSASSTTNAATATGSETSSPSSSGNSNPDLDVDSSSCILSFSLFVGVLSFVFLF